jgi:hypothetical protein
MITPSQERAMQRIRLSLSETQQDNATTYTAPVRYTPHPMGRVTGLDGHVSTYFLPSPVEWQGGRLDQLRGHHHVLIVNDLDGAHVFEGSICWLYTPQETDKETFWTLPQEAR